MKKVLNVLALVGVVIIVGAVGTQDYMVEVGMYYPISRMLKPLCLGAAMILPVIGRRVWQEIH